MFRNSVVRPGGKLELSDFSPLLLELVAIDELERSDGVVGESQLVDQSHAHAAVKLGPTAQRGPVLITLDASALWNDTREKTLIS